jgi:hypothetical protein
MRIGTAKAPVTESERCYSGWWTHRPGRIFPDACAPRFQVVIEPQAWGHELTFGVAKVSFIDLFAFQKSPQFRLGYAS